MKKLVGIAVLAAMISCGTMPGGMDQPIDPFWNGEGSEIESQRGDSTIDSTIKNYDGETANDISADVTDPGAPDLFWENGTFKNEIIITWDGSSVQVSKSDDNIKCYATGGHVTVDLITGSVEGVNLILKGTSTDGSIKIYGNKKFKMTLSGLDLTSTKGPAINSQNKKRVYVHLAEGSTNRLCDAATYSDDALYYNSTTAADEDRKGAFFTEGSQIYSGSGILVVDGKYKHGICSDGFIYVRPGVTIVVQSAAKNCIHANGDEDDNLGIKVTGGLIYASNSSTAGKCIKCDMNVEVTGGKLYLYTSGGAEYDSTEKDTSSASCIKSDADITITGGTLEGKSTGTAGKGFKAEGNIVLGNKGEAGPTVTLTTTGSSYGSSSSGGGMGGPGGGMGGPGGGSSSSSASSKAKAIKAEGTITINSGTYDIRTAKSGAEGIESKSAVAESIVINGGNLYMQCYDDCINSAGQIVFNDGNVFAYSTGNDAVDSNYGRSGAVTVNGGCLIAHGTSSPEEGIDADNNNYLTFNGGLIFTTGGRQSNSGSPQGKQACNSLSGSVSVGYFTVTDQSGNVVFSSYVPRKMSQNYSYISSPDLKSGTTYKCGVSSSVPSGSTWNWSTYIYKGGTASVSSSFTAK